MSVYFDNDKHTLRRDSKITLDRLSDSVAGLNITKITTTGNTDSNADSLYNVRLSDRRTKSVTDYLVAKGLNSNLFKTDYFGEEKPLVSNETDDGKQKNRRVDIVVYYRLPVKTVIPETTMVTDSQRVPIEIVSSVIDTCKADTIIVLPGGTRVVFNKCEYLRKKDCLSFTEILTSEQAREQGLTTVNVGGDPLASCGMFSINVLRPACESCFDHPVKIMLPAPERVECDGCRGKAGLYDIGPNGEWIPSKTKIRPVMVDGNYYYEYTVKCPERGKKNCDCNVAYGKTKVKIRRRYKLIDVTLSSDCPLAVYGLEVKKFRKHVTKKTEVGCFIGSGDITATVVNRKGETFTVNTQPLENIRKKKICGKCKSLRWRFLYIFKFYNHPTYRKYKIRERDLTKKES